MTSNSSAASSALLVWSGPIRRSCKPVNLAPAIRPARLRVLHAVFAEDALPGGQCSFNPGLVLAFGRGNQSHALTDLCQNPLPGLAYVVHVCICAHHGVETPSRV